MVKYICSNCGKEFTKIYPICTGCKQKGTIEEVIVKKKRSALLLISAILGVLYAVYIVSYFAGSSIGSSGAEAIGVGIATALVIPHMLFAVLAAIFNVLGWSMSSRGFALTGAILYAVAAVMFPMYAMFVLIQMVLSFVGFARLKSLNG